MANSVFIATSLDGFIAREDGGLDWLTPGDSADGNDYGYDAFISGIDAIVMGRNTFEKVLGFGEWPYAKPVFILSGTLLSVPGHLAGKAEIVHAAVSDLVGELASRGLHDLYIDGGKTIQSFLREDLIEEMIITTIPVLIGGGYRLFGNLDGDLSFRLMGSTVFDNGFVQNRYVRKRD